MDDMQLLREYATGGSEQAFTTLVARYLSMVHSVALRHVRDPHQAEEITQAVFVILARKAGALPERTILSGWLFHTARLTAANFVRSETRRARREQEAYMQSRMRENQTNDPWGQMAPLLDEAIASLNENDRNAIVLRFVEGRDFCELGSALGASEDGVRMRVNRALEKLRVFLARRGVALSVVAIAGALSANAVQAAPPALLGSVAAAAAQGTSTTTSTATLIKGTLKLMAWTKLKIAAVTVVGVLLAAGTATVTVKAMRNSHWTANGAGTKFDPALDKLLDHYSQAFQSRDRSARQTASQAIVQFVTKHPPMMAIRPTRLQSSHGGGGSTVWGIQKGAIAAGVMLPQVLRYAYGLDPDVPRYRIIVPPELATARYDYVDTMAQGGKEALQRELKERFGVVGRREMRLVDALALTVKNPDAPGLKRHADADAGGFGSSFGGGRFEFNNRTMTDLANNLSEMLGEAVIDQTGLSGGFDCKLLAAGNSPEDIKQAVLDQLGLELAPMDKQPVEFLVAEKVR